MTSYGFITVPYDDNLARSSYIEQLPMLAECLSFQAFSTEMQTILRSVAPNAILLVKFVEAFSQTLSVLSQDNAYEALYVAGERVCSQADDKGKKSFLTLAEETLQKYDQISYEYTKFLAPELKKCEWCTNKFALWRLCRLTVLLSDFSMYEEDVFKMFAARDLTNAAEALCVLNSDLAKRYLVKVLTTAGDPLHVNAINAIERHGFDLTDPLVSIPLLHETGRLVLERIAKLPPHLLSEDLLVKLLETDSVSSTAGPIALKSPHFPRLLAKLKEKAVVCELNLVDFEVIKKCKPLPWDYLALMLRESKELLTEATINGIMGLRSDDILYKLVLPRMNEKGSWRSRFNAVAIFKQVLVTAADWDMCLGEYAGFVVAMGLDHVYAVREAAFSTLELFPPGEELSCVLEPLFSLTERAMADLQLNILRQLMTQARKVIIGNFSEAKLRPILRRVGIDEAKYFDKSH
jgi:hypothetical protein